MDNRMMMRGASSKVAIMHTDLTCLLPGAQRAPGTREGRVINPEAVLVWSWRTRSKRGGRLRRAG